MRGEEGEDDGAPKRKRTTVKKAPVKVSPKTSTSKKR